MAAFRHRAPEEAEMPVVGSQIVVLLHAFVEGAAPQFFMQIIAVHHLQGDFGDDAEHADGNAGGVQHVRLAVVDGENAAIRLHQPHADDLRGHVAKRKPGAVRSGGERARQRLAVDIALVDHRQTAALQRLSERVDGRSGMDGDALAGGVDMADALQARERQMQPAGQRHRGKRMPGAGAAHVQPVRRCLAHHLSQRRLAIGRAPVPDDARLISHPVAPVAA